jgi:hypothetical protein
VPPGAASVPGRQHTGIHIYIAWNLPNRLGAVISGEMEQNLPVLINDLAQERARSSFIFISPSSLISDSRQNLYGAPASYLALAGRVYIAPVAGSTHGHGLLPKKAGFELRYIEFGMANPPGVLCQCCEFVRKS